jgi:hypothetical protein
MKHGLSGECLVTANSDGCYPLACCMGRAQLIRARQGWINLLWSCPPASCCITSTCTTIAHAVEGEDSGWQGDSGGEEGGHGAVTEATHPAPMHPDDGAGSYDPDLIPGIETGDDVIEFYGKFGQDRCVYATQGCAGCTRVMQASRPGASAKSCVLPVSPTVQLSSRYIGRRSGDCRVCHSGGLSNNSQGVQGGEERWEGGI